MKTCENTKCDQRITIPSVDMPGQCLLCAEKARERIIVWQNSKSKMEKSNGE